MRLRLTLLLTALLLIGSCTAVSIITKFRGGEPVLPLGESQISFKLQGHKIMVPVRLNDFEREQCFLLDTGAMSAIDLTLADELGLAPGQALPTPNDTVMVYLTEQPLVIGIGEAAVRDLHLVRFDLSNTFRMKKFDGFIGSNLLRHFRVTIDYAQQQLTLGRSGPVEPASGLANDPPLRMSFRSSFPLYFPLLACSLRDGIEAEAMIDSGSPYLLVLPLELLESAVIATGAPYIRGRGPLVKWPFTDDDACYLARLPRFQLGELLLQDLPVVLADLPSGDDHLLLGRDFLAEFVTTLDYPAEEILFSPVGEVEFPRNVTSTGLKLDQKPEGTFVRGFWEGSPAEEAGLVLGDEVVRIDGVAATDYSRQALSDLLNDQSRRSIELALLREGVLQTVEIPLRPLLP